MKWQYWLTLIVVVLIVAKTDTAESANNPGMFDPRDPYGVAFQ